MKVENGHNVKVHYKGTFSDGTEFDNSRNRGKTLDFEVGIPHVRGFNEAVMGMTEGETKTIVLGPDEAYGEINPRAFQKCTQSSFWRRFCF
jgi:FKBP-type peptidyl-prolyl cis-trans isomerase